MLNTFRLDITTPQGSEYSGELVHARIPQDSGFVGVLANHAPFVTILGAGLCHLREKNGTEVVFKVGEGFFSVAHNTATLLTQSLEKAAS